MCKNKKGPSRAPGQLFACETRCSEVIHPGAQTLRQPASPPVTNTTVDTSAAVFFGCEEPTVKVTHIKTVIECTEPYQRQLCLFYLMVLQVHDKNVTGRPTFSLLLRAPRKFVAQTYSGRWWNTFAGPLSLLSCERLSVLGGICVRHVFHLFCASRRWL